MARNMFADGERDTKIYAVVLEVRNPDGSIHKWYNATNGPYPQESTAKGQVTRLKKWMEQRLKHETVRNEVGSWDVWIEEGTIEWKRVDEKH
jgi:hypothetical protein